MIGGHWFCDQNCKSHIQITDAPELRWHFEAPSCTISSLSEWNPSVSPVIGLGALKTWRVLSRAGSKAEQLHGRCPGAGRWKYLRAQTRPGLTSARRSCRLLPLPDTKENKAPDENQYRGWNHDTGYRRWGTTMRTRKERSWRPFPCHRWQYPDFICVTIVIWGLFLAGRGQQGASPLDRPGLLWSHVFRLYGGGRVVPSLTKILGTLRPTLH